MAVLNTINTFFVLSATNTGADTAQPYNFQEWKIRNTNVAPNDLIPLYNTYLKTWYLRKDLSNAVSVDYVKNYYKSFLQSLGVAPRNSAEEVLFNNVDLSNDLSVQSAIVGYARRLKDIAVYIANKRNDVVYSKLRDNLTGTSTSLEKLFYSYILNAFTRKLTPDGLITTSFTITNPNILTSLPFLNVITPDFDVEIEEIYDTNNYFDRDPAVPITTYTAVASEVPEALYKAGSYNTVFLSEDYLIANIIGAVAINSIALTSAEPLTYFTFTGDGSTTSFSLSNITSSRASDYQVSIEGVIQTPNNSYTVSTVNQTLTFSEPPPVGSVIVIILRY